MQNKIRKGEIYIISNTDNNKKYIGQTTVGYITRWNQHRCRAKYDKYYDHCWALYYALRNHGEEKFDIKVLETIDIRLDDKGAKVKEDADKLDALEIKYIKQYNSVAPNGYNLQSGGKNSKYCYESLQKRADARKNAPELTAEERKQLRENIVKEDQLKKEAREKEKNETKIKYEAFMKDMETKREEKKIERENDDNPKEPGRRKNCGNADDTYRQNISECHRILKAHNGQDLPMYVCRSPPNPKRYQGEGYMIRHPNDNGKAKYFTSKKISMDEKLNKVIAYYNEKQNKMKNE